MSRRTWRNRAGDILAWVLVAIAIIVIFGAAFGIRLWMAGGDFGCAFSADPALCATVGRLP